jgi:pimeloyl-ACP methyl ester carboxylesterase
MNLNGFILCLIFLPLHLFAQHTNPTSEANYFTSFDSTKIYYEVKGKGKPVILVHGFVVNSESWKRSIFYNDLQKSGYQVITLDLRGNGKSDKPHIAEAYLNDAEAKDIMRLVDVLRLKQYDVVGYSRGAIITARLLVFDKRVNHAVLGGMGDDFTNPQWPRRVMFYEGLAGIKAHPEVAGLVKHIKETGLDQQALALMQNGQPSTSPKELGEIKKPVLVICGTEDEDNGSSKDLAALIPGASYVRVPGDHNKTASTQLFSDEVLKFFSQTK